VSIMAGQRMRQLRGMEIVARGGNIRRVSESHYLVRSQNGNGWYKVQWRNTRWICDCPDYEKRREACKHVYAVTFLLKLPHILLTNLNYDLMTCPRCDAKPERIISIGLRRNRSGATRRFKCKECGYKFSDRLGFAKMRNDPLMIIATLDLYFKGLSVRQIQHHLSTVYGCEASHMSPYRWIKKYVELLSRYVNELTPKVGGRWHADDMFVKVNGATGYLWDVLDRKTRYLLVSELTTGRSTEEAYTALKEALTHAGKKANTVVSDGLDSYRKAVKRLRIRRHISRPRFTDPSNNNIVERLHGTLRPRYDLTRGLGGVETGRIMARGVKLYYNFIRPHSALNGKTPSDPAGIKLKGRNRWLALARNASKKNERCSPRLPRHQERTYSPILRRGNRTEDPAPLVLIRPSQVRHKNRLQPVEEKSPKLP